MTGKHKGELNVKKSQSLRRFVKKKKTDENQARRKTRGVISGKLRDTNVNREPPREERKGSEQRKRRPLSGGKRWSFAGVSRRISFRALRKRGGARETDGIRHRLGNWGSVHFHGSEAVFRESHKVGKAQMELDLLE